MRINLLDSLTTAYTCTTALDYESDELDNAVTLLTTTLSLLDISTVDITFAQNYVESLSNEELAELTVKLDEKEQESDLSREEPIVKIHTKS